MFSSILRAFVGSATAGLLVVAASATAAPGPAIATPFVIDGVLLESVGPASRCPSQFGGTITGSGNSPLMGKVVFIATDCIVPDGPLFNFSAGKFIVMTTSGDQVYAEYSGQFVPTGDGTKFVFSGGTFRITGGTGSYVNAGGGGVLSGGEDMATGAGTIKLTGKISFITKA